MDLGYYTYSSHLGALNWYHGCFLHQETNHLNKFIQMSRALGHYCAFSISMQGNKNKVVLLAFLCREIKTK
jgi:hypothetical protein